MRDFVISSESVTVGHPDKLCDQFSDAIIDAYLAAGLKGYVTAESAIATGVIFQSIHAGHEAPFDVAALVRGVMNEAGYQPSGLSRDPTVMLDSTVLPAALENTAGQMVTAFGYACRHSDSFLPFPIWAAHRLTASLDRARIEGRIPWLHPDATAQVAVEFRDRKPHAIRAIAITAGGPDAPDDIDVSEAFLREVITPGLEGAPLLPDKNTRFVLTATRREGGPSVHSGLTGRKVNDDTYGGFVRQSTAALSGKGPKRIDRIAVYAARQAARAVVTAELAEECEVQLSYIVGDEGPVSVELDTFGSGRKPDAELSARVREVFDFRADAIAERMGLWSLPSERGGRFYRDFASYGHIGRDDLAPPWEDMAIAAELS